MINNSKKIKITLATLTSCLALSSTVFATNFKDIENHWGKDHIVNLTSKNIINGYSDNTFKPNNTITRAEFSKLISTALKIEDNNKEEVVFKDIEGTWAEKKIEALANKNIIDKSEYKEYKANENITRIEIAKMAVRALNLDQKAKEISKNTNFKDDDLIKKEDKGYVILTVENKIVNGYIDETFKPDSTATRAEASKMIVSLLEAIENQKEIVDSKEKVEEEKSETKENKKESESKEVEAKKEKTNIEEMKTQEFTINKKENIDILEVKELEVVNTDRYVGVIKMKFPEDKYKFEFKNLDFEGKTYIQGYCDELVEDDFGSGLFLDGNGKKIGGISRIGGYKSDLIDVKQDFRPYYSFGLKEDNILEKAEYIAFERSAENYKEYSNSKDKYKRVLVIFENPFKKN